MRPPGQPRPSVRVRVARGVVLAALGPLLLAGCSSSGTTSGSTTAASSGGAATATNGGAATASPPAPATAAAPATPGSTSVSFAGVTVAGASDLAHEPGVTAGQSQPAPGLEVQDLVVGTGPAPSASSSVSVQYVGALLKDGTVFDASWRDGGSPATFPLSGVVQGFAQGIGGTPGVEPMHVGGRRLMIFPASLGYGDQPNQAIPAGSSLVFVVDLTSVS